MARRVYLPPRHATTRRSYLGARFEGSDGVATLLSILEADEASGERAVALDLSLAAITTGNTGMSRRCRPVALPTSRNFGHDSEDAFVVPLALSSREGRQTVTGGS
jgi:hypothetical protein